MVVGMIGKFHAFVMPGHDGCETNRVQGLKQ